MREVKFKVWNQYGPTMTFGWGAFTDESNKQHVVVDRDDGVPGPKLVQGILMQFTGLIDKNGRDVYEGV